MRLAENSTEPHSWPMTPAGEIRLWLKQSMEATGLSVAEWAQRANVHKATIFRALKEDYEFVTSSRTLAKLATAAGVPLPAIVSPRELQIIPRMLEVRFRVQAGHWIEVDEMAQVRPSEIDRPVSPDPRFGDWPQWLEEVVGDSIDKKIRPGGFAHVVDAIEMGYAAQQGDFVVVERRRDGGQIRERSIKQVEINKRGVVELWPRSSNPRWSEPLVMAAGTDGKDFEAEIVGLVIGAYEAFR